MKLLWSSRSPFVRKVMVAAHEVGVASRIETERVLVGADKPNAEVMGANPLNKIPTLFLDDGTALYNSRVICEYLDTLHAGPKLIPADPAARFAALRRQSLGDGLMELNVLRLGEQNRPPPAPVRDAPGCIPAQDRPPRSMPWTRKPIALRASRTSARSPSPPRCPISISASPPTTGARAGPGSHAGMPRSPSASRCWPPSTSTPTRGVAQAHRGKDTHPWSSLRRARSPASITAASATSP